MENRDHILDCALRLFAARGYDAVGVQEIVELAGLTKPTLYHYFGSKRGLLETDSPFYSHQIRWNNTARARRFLAQNGKMLGGEDFNPKYPAGRAAP